MLANAGLSKAGKADEKPTESEGENSTTDEVQPGNGQGKVILSFLVHLQTRTIRAPVLKLIA